MTADRPRACTVQPWDDPYFPNSIPYAKALREKRGDLVYCLRCGGDFVTLRDDWYCPRCRTALET